MDDYDRACQAAAKRLMLTYSTSFSSASRQFSKALRQPIYNIYSLVRLADEIVDTYTGSDKRKQLDDLEVEVYRAVQNKYSVNPIVHAFQLTANAYGINKALITPFFASMRIDVEPANYRADQYKSYIHGSAEVVGLMCLHVFIQNDQASYEQLESGAKALGAAFQKVNFLRDLADDNKRLGRYYFPNGNFRTFDDVTKAAIIKDIRHDFNIARSAVLQLPQSSRPAVKLAYNYYVKLLDILEAIPAEQLKRQRPRVNSFGKFTLLVKSKLGIQR